MRQALTPPEAALWKALKGKKLEGFAFRRQHPVGPFILDFYCEAAKLAVEFDGEGHDTPEAIGYDRRRDAWLRARGVATLRVSASGVPGDLDAALSGILSAARLRAPSVTP